MLLDSLLTNTCNFPDSTVQKTSIKFNKPSYLFSDIIRLVGSDKEDLVNITPDAMAAGNSKSDLPGLLNNLPQDQSLYFNTSWLQQAVNNTSQNNQNGQTVLPANQAALPYLAAINKAIGNAGSADAQLLNPSTGQVQNIISASGLQDFLAALSSKLTALGFELKSIKGIQTGTSGQNQTAGTAPDLTEIKTPSSNSKSSDAQLLNVNESGGKANSCDKVKNQGSGTEGQQNLNINQAIFAILQSNRPVILNFNYAGQNLKIEITNAQDIPDVNAQVNVVEASTSSQPATALNQPEEISNGPASSTGGSIPVNKISSGGVKTNYPDTPLQINVNEGLTAQSALNNPVPVNEAGNTIDFQNLENNPERNKGEQVPVISEISNKAAAPANLTNNNSNGTNAAAQVNKIVSAPASASGDASKPDQAQIQPEPNFRVAVTAGGKSYSVSGVQDLEQLLSELNVKDNIEIEYLSPKEKLVYNYNSLAGSGKLQNAGNAASESIQPPKNYFPGENLAVNESSFPDYINEILNGPKDSPLNTAVSMKQQLLSGENFVKTNSRRLSFNGQTSAGGTSTSMQKPLAEVIEPAFPDAAKISLPAAEAIQSDWNINSVSLQNKDSNINGISAEGAGDSNSLSLQASTAEELLSSVQSDLQNTGSIKNISAGNNPGSLSASKIFKENTSPIKDAGKSSQQNTGGRPVINDIVIEVKPNQKYFAKDVVIQKDTSAASHQNNTQDNYAQGISGTGLTSGNLSEAPSTGLNKSMAVPVNSVAGHSQSGDNTEQDNPINKLAAASQSSAQPQADSNLKQSDGLNGTSQAAAGTGVSQAANVKADASGGDAEKRSGSDRKQFDDTRVSSAQAVNSDKQTAFKIDSAETNLNKYGGMYKTVNASDLVPEISNFMRQGESKSLTLKLQPGDLGKVKVALEVVDKVVHANIEVENESVKQMVQNNINDLRQSLNVSGLQLSNVSVSLAGGEGKSGKTFTQKRKATSNSYNKKIDAGSGIAASKSLGYNTYEYLI